MENAEVWVPFHFLPALDGDTLDQQLVCRKNSVLAQALAADMRTYSGKDRLFRLGITFCMSMRIPGHIRSFRDHECREYAAGAWVAAGAEDQFGVAGVQGGAVCRPKPLGHASAVHFPDQPYLYWHSEQKFPEGRSNWVEFLEAARALYQILCVVGESPVRELSSQAGAVLVGVVSRRFQDEDCNDRGQRPGCSGFR